MNQHSFQDFRKTALETRYLLLLAITHLRKKNHFGASEIALELTTNAIKHHLLEQREVPTGAMLQRWIKNKNPPAWIIKSATLLLIESSSYKPQENEIIPLSFTFADIYKENSIEEITKKIPVNIKSHLSFDLMEKAIKAGDRERKGVQLRS